MSVRIRRMYASRRGTWLGFALAMLLVGPLGCGAGTTGATSVAGRTSTPHPPAPVELSLRTPDGAFVDVGDLRGAPTLIFLFATFDTASQAAVRPVRRFFLLHRDVHVVGIAVQPEAQRLVGPYAEALEIPFTVTYDPDSRVAVGATDLGTVDAVPMFVMLDAAGFVVGRHVGFPSDRKLEEMLARATTPPSAAPR